jgi:hypothetical protein
MFPGKIYSSSPDVYFMVHFANQQIQIYPETNLLNYHQQEFHQIFRSITYCFSIVLETIIINNMTF